MLAVNAALGAAKHGCSKRFAVWALRLEVLKSMASVAGSIIKGSACC